jgi:hypothetical protein
MTDGTENLRGGAASPEEKRGKFVIQAWDPTIGAWRDKGTYLDQTHLDENLSRLGARGERYRQKPESECVE